MTAIVRIVRPALVALGAITAGLLCQGCGTAGEVHDPASLAPRDAAITLWVDNNNWENVRISLLRDGLPLPIGTVESMDSRLFRIPVSRLGTDCSVCLRIHLVVSNAWFATVPVLVEPGQTVEARIAGRLNHSSVVVRF